MEQERREMNKMGVMPVNRLLISISLPIMVSMLVQALYNIVDSIFVAKISQDALTAVSLAFPIQNLMIAVATGIGVGINALLSKSLGERNFTRANHTAGNGVLLIIPCTLLFLIFGLFFSEMFFRTQTTELPIIQHGTEYIRICTCLSFGLFGQITFERLLQSTGKTIHSMISQATGAIINIVLDPILIFGYFGLPALGVTGAALATVIGQILAFIIGILLNHFLNREIRLSPKTFIPDRFIMGKIFAVGLPSIVMQSISSVMTYGVNQILLRFSTTATTVFGVYFKLQSFIFMPVFGLNNGLVPIIAYNYGARKKERILHVLKLAILYAVAIMFIGLLVFQCFPSALLSMFDASDEMLVIGIPSLRFISLSFLFAGVSIVLVASLQALAQGVYSLMISVARQLVVILPVAYLLSLSGNVDYVWLAFPIAELVSVLLCVLFFMRAYRKLIKPLDAPLHE